MRESALLQGEINGLTELVCKTRVRFPLGKTTNYGYLFHAKGAL